MNDATNDTTRTEWERALDGEPCYLCGGFEPDAIHDDVAHANCLDPDCTHHRYQFLPESAQGIGELATIAMLLRKDLDRLAGPVCDYPPCKGARAIECGKFHRFTDGSEAVLYYVLGHPPSPPIEAWLRECGK